MRTYKNSALYGEKKILNVRATYIARLEVFVEKWIKLSGTNWTTEWILKKFVVEQLYNMCTLELSTHLRKGGKTDLYRLASIADQHTGVRNLVAGQPRDKGPT